jgi:putative ABC transport system permease protein
MNKDGMVVVRLSAVTPAASQSMMRAMAADPALKGAALSGDVPFDGSNSNNIFQLPGEPARSLIRAVVAGPDFFSLYGIKLLSGRTLSWGDIARKHEAYNIVINASAARRFHFSPDGALGKTILTGDDEQHPDRLLRATIVGVVADFIFESDKRVIVPTIYGFDPENMSYVSAKVPAGGVPQALAAIDRIWHAFEPSSAINRHFLDEDFQKQFEADEQEGRIFGIFVGIAIFIACLGLFGLAAFSTERRTKEIGIRKSFGAKSRDIVWMLLWQFSIPVLIANLIAWPVAYYYLHNWLEEYAYRISLNPLYFLGAGLTALMIAWITVFLHAQRVARANPIHALRYE